MWTKIKEIGLIILGVLAVFFVGRRLLDYALGARAVRKEADKARKVRERAQKDRDSRIVKAQSATEKADRESEERVRNATSTGNLADHINSEIGRR